MGSLGGGAPPLGRGTEFGTPFWSILGSLLGPLGDPLGDPWGPQGARRGPKALRRGLRRGPPRGTPKMNHFGPPPWRGSGELSLGREHSFQGFRGVTFGPHFGSILEPIWDPRRPLFSPRGPKRGIEGVEKRVPKRGRFLTPLFEPKMDPKMGGTRRGTITKL